MATDFALTCRFFVTYVGVKLPLTLVEPLDEAAVRNRNIFIRAYFDDRDRLVSCEKVVSGDLHLSHKYDYHVNGQLKSAEIFIPDEEEEPTILNFDETGRRL